MTATLLDGDELSLKIRKKLAFRVNALKSSGISPTIAMVCVDTGIAESSYVRHKIKACENVGIVSIIKKLPKDISEWKLESVINDLNNDDNIHGILIQLPLPEHINSNNVLSSIT